MSGAVDPWLVIAYEVRMFRATFEIMLDPDRLAELPKVLANAVEESAVLHARILCDVFRSVQSEPDDIALSKLFPDWRDARCRRLRQATAALEHAYGSSPRKGSPCWVFNKLMAHPTTHRGPSYDYIPILRDLRPLLQAVIAEIEALRGATFTWTW